MTLEPEAHLSVPDAVERDPRLDRVQKAAMLVLYSTFLGEDVAPGASADQGSDGEAAPGSA